MVPIDRLEITKAVGIVKLTITMTTLVIVIAIATMSSLFLFPIVPIIVATIVILPV